MTAVSLPLKAARDDPIWQACDYTARVHPMLLVLLCLLRGRYLDGDDK
jgi:hypothetical protein